MGKHVKRTYEEKEKIVKEYIGGKSGSYLARKYNIADKSIISTWKKKYLNGTLQNDNRGAPKINNSKELEYEILKKSFALLKEIRSEQNK